jgi:hypothetical protein
MQFKIKEAFVDETKEPCQTPKVLRFSRPKSLNMETNPRQKQGY